MGILVRGKKLENEKANKCLLAHGNSIPDKLSGNNDKDNYEDDIIQKGNKIWNYHNEFNSNIYG